MQAAEKTAIEHDCIALRLEVRADNHGALSLYEKLGYSQFGTYEHYYEDDQTALRLEKLLVAQIAPPSRPPPYYRQTLEFTCGPACLLMALGWADPDFHPSRAAEVQLWREATTIFMMSGPGGCEPFGLAVSAYESGLAPEIFVSFYGALFLQSVRSEDKRRVMELAQVDFRRRAELSASR